MRIALCGLGRAGSTMAKVLLSADEQVLYVALCRDESSASGKDIGDIINISQQEITVTKLSEAVGALNNNKVDIIIDFSGRETTLQLLDICAKIGCGLVICTTDFTSKEVERFQSYPAKYGFGIVYAPNLTRGINILIEFIRKTSDMLFDFDFEIIERHRRDKSKPSTTANIIKSAIGRSNTPISSIRVGGYVGIHEVTAANENERITIIHESFSRNAFADGALMAAKFLCGKQGYYEMRDVLANAVNPLMNEI